MCDQLTQGWRRGTGVDDNVNSAHHGARAPPSLSHSPVCSLDAAAQRRVEQLRQAILKAV